MSALGARLKALRTERGLTQRELAAGICDRSFLSQVEHGRAAPSEYCLSRLAERLGVDASLLLRCDPAPTQRSEIRRLLASAKGVLAAGRAVEAVALYTSAARRAAVSQLRRLAAKAQEGVAEAQLALGDPAAAMDAADRALHIHQVEGDGLGVARAYRLLGQCHFELDVYEEALRCFQRGLESLAARPDVAAVRAPLLFHLADTCHRLDRGAEVMRHAQAAMEAARCARQPLWLAWATWAKGLGHRRLGQGDAAWQALQDARRAFTRLRHRAGVHACRHHLALIEGDRGNWARALAELNRCARYLRRRRMWRELASAMSDIAVARLALGEPEAARKACAEGLAAIPRGERLTIRSRLYEVLAEVHDVRGHPELASVYRRAGQELRAAAKTGADRRAALSDTGTQATAT